MSRRESDRLGAVFAALAHPTRRDILSRLRGGKLSVGELAAAYPTSGPAITQHLNVLEEAGLIVRETRRQWRDCAATDDGLDAAAEWIAQQRGDWNERFDLLAERIADNRKETAMRTATGFTIERSFDATPEELWDAWTNPDEAQHWWHPRGVRTPRESISIDARVGGRYAYTMVSDASGEEFPTGGVYLEVVRPERLVFTWGGLDDDPDDCPVVTVAIARDGDGSHMTFTMTRLARMSDEVRDGWSEALDVLAEHLGGTR